VATPLGLPGGSNRSRLVRCDSWLCQRDGERHRRAPEARNFHTRSGGRYGTATGMGWRNPARFRDRLCPSSCTTKSRADRTRGAGWRCLPPPSLRNWPTCGTRVQHDYLRAGGGGAGGRWRVADRAWCSPSTMDSQTSSRSTSAASSRYGFTATVFVTTGWIADAGRHSAGTVPVRCCAGHRSVKQWQPVWRLRRIATPSPTHQLKQGRLEDELATSKALLEDGMAAPCLVWPTRSAIAAPECGARSAPLVTVTRAR